MTIKDLSELLNYVMKNNSWEKSSTLMKGRKAPKYLDFKIWFTLDTRDGIIFYFKTRHAGRDKSFRVEDKKDLKKVYEWLDEIIIKEWNDNNE